MEIIGTEGAMHIQDSAPNFSLYDRDGGRSPDTTYWPMLHSVRSGYFSNCILEARKPSIITPEEAMTAVRACLAADESAASGQAVRLA
jgi:UDP-N-acetylglucosamine 3-dehydrogenase